MSAQTQIQISAQVWVCDACGGQDNKSCGCNSTAHQEELAAKREDARQRKIRSRKKAKQNQQSCHSDADIENIEGNAGDPEASAEAMKAQLAASMTIPARSPNACGARRTKGTEPSPTWSRPALPKSSRL
jgi:hypothetical protein